jgi:anti-anti-sigma factor
MMVEQRFLLSGEFDLANTPGLLDDLCQIVSATGADLVVDCSELRFIDSSGIKVLIQVRNALDAQGRRFRMQRLPPTPLRTLEVLGLLEVLGVET